LLTLPRPLLLLLLACRPAPRAGRARLRHNSHHARGAAAATAAKGSRCARHELQGGGCCRRCPGCSCLPRGAACRMLPARACCGLSIARSFFACCYLSVCPSHRIACPSSQRVQRPSSKQSRAAKGAAACSRAAAAQAGALSCMGRRRPVLRQHTWPLAGSTAATGAAAAPRQDLVTPRALYQQSPPGYSSARQFRPH